MYHTPYYTKWNNISHKKMIRYRNELPHGKTNNLHTRKQRRRSASQYLNCEADQRLCFRCTDSTIPVYFLNPKFPASSHLLCLYSSVCVGLCSEATLLVFPRGGSNVKATQQRAEETVCALRCFSRWQPLLKSYCIAHIRDQHDFH